MTESGFARLTAEHAMDAVSWWYYSDFADGFAYARGGRVRSARAARKAIRDCHDASIREHRVWLNRRTHELGGDGELIPIDLVDTFSWRKAQ